MALIFPVLTLSMPAAFTNYLPYLCIEVDNIQRKGQKGKKPDWFVVEKTLLVVFVQIFDNASLRLHRLLEQ